MVSVMIVSSLGFERVRDLARYGDELDLAIFKQELYFVGAFPVFCGYFCDAQYFPIVRRFCFCRRLAFTYFGEAWAAC